MLQFFKPKSSSRPATGAADPTNDDDPVCEPVLLQETSKAADDHVCTVDKPKDYATDARVENDEIPVCTVDYATVGESEEIPPSVDTDSAKDPACEDKSVSVTSKRKRDSETCEYLSEQDEQDNTVDTGEERVKKSVVRKFQNKWLKLYSWLAYDKDTKMMTCTICIQQKKTNSFTDGCDNYRTNALQRHVDHQGHKHAVSEAKQRKDMKTVVVTAHTKKNDAIVKALRNVYWLVMEKIPLAKFSSMQEHSKLQGVNLDALSTHGDSYSSRFSAEEFLDAIVQVLETRINTELKDSKVMFFSLMIDESTDITITKKLVIYVRYVYEDMAVKTTFLGNLALEDPSVTAGVLNTKMNEYLMKRGFNYKKMVGFGSDGAAIMTGKICLFV
jgi:hypothetical protein